MILFFTLGLLLGAVAVMFALQNTFEVTVTFFTWTMTGSLALILILTIVAGMLVALLGTFPKSIRDSMQNRRALREIRALKEEIRKQNEALAFTKMSSPTQQDIATIERGAIETSAYLA